VLLVAASQAECPRARQEGLADAVPDHGPFEPGDRRGWGGRAADGPAQEAVEERREPDRGDEPEELSDHDGPPAAPPAFMRAIPAFRLARLGAPGLICSRRASALSASSIRPRWKPATTTMLYSDCQWFAFAS